MNIRKKLNKRPKIVWPDCDDRLGYEKIMYGIEYCVYFGYAKWVNV